MGPSMEMKKSLAYIITASCSSDRFNVTKGNLEVFFPNMFDIRCFVMVPLNDSRIHSGPVLIMKQFSSNLISFIDLWTFTIPVDTNYADSQWSFVFEDDVNFNNPQKVFLNDYTNAMKELMEHPEVRRDGFFYLGICGPSFLNDTQPLYSSNTRNTLYSQKASGFCLHASAITTKRARYLWTDISSYRPNLDLSLDKQLRDYSIRSKKYFYTFGSNFLFPPNTGHYGIAFQDRGRFSTMFRAST